MASHFISSMRLIILRQHINRTHIPLRCVNCKIEMGSLKAIAKHLNVPPDQRCEQRPDSDDDRIAYNLWQTLYQSSQLTGKSVEEKWTMMYQALFPGDTRVPSPCE
jgi:hypothetical protein